jgi:hypothetical protein
MYRLSVILITNMMSAIFSKTRMFMNVVVTLSEVVEFQLVVTSRCWVGELAGPPILILTLLPAPATQSSPQIFKT